MAVQADNYKTWVKMITGLYILEILKENPAYGNKIADDIKRRTKDTLHPNPNALYPLLRSMEQLRYITGNWDNPEKRNKRVYTLTEFGREQIPELRRLVRKRVEEGIRKLEILRKDLHLDEELHNE